MRSVRSALLPLVLLALVAVGSLQYAAGQRQPVAQPAPAPGLPQQAEAAPAPQPTRLQIEFFQLMCNSQQLAELDLDKVTAGNPPAAEFAKRLAAFGEARLLARLDSQVNLLTKSAITFGNRAPTVQDVTRGKDGKVTPSVSYQEIGSMVNCTGTWLSEQPARGSILADIELSNVSYSSLGVSSGVKLPVFNHLKLSQTLLVESGRPLVLMGSQIPLAGEKPSDSVVVITRLTATRLDVPADNQ